MKTTTLISIVLALVVPVIVTAEVDDQGMFISFIRGDVDHNDVVNIVDAIVIIRYILGDEVAADKIGDCLDSADADDDGGVNIPDAIYLLNYLFRNGPPPKWPFPDPGIDPLPFEGILCGWAS